MAATRNGVAPVTEERAGTEPSSEGPGSASAPIMDVKLELQNENGKPYFGRFRGRRVDLDASCDLYMMESGRILLHDCENADVDVFDTDQASDMIWMSLRKDEYVEAMTALGLESVVDL